MLLKTIFPKFFFLLVVFISLSFCFTKAVYVEESHFVTDYRVTYSPGEDGLTHAVLNITLTNTSSEFYASSYKVQLGFDDIINIRASDPDGPIDPVLSKTEDGYVIGLRFNKKAVGLGTKLNFNVSFDTPEVAQRYGKIWEINIPGIANPEEFQSFNVEVDSPASFGKPTYIKPNQETNSLIFTKDQLGKSGISIAFGDKQIYSFHLTYHLKNENVYPIKTEIALPPTTNYQDVYIQNISPRPLNVTIDKDGNWLAEYKLIPSKKLDVTVDGKAKVYLNPRPEQLSEEDRVLYTQEKPYWQAKSDKIRELADELRTPEAIYSYVIETLNYDFSRVTDNKPRLGALAVLQNPDSAVCLEFTDLFIAIARAAGIPAREVNGFAYTENSKQRPLSLVKDILHAWPEYYDKDKKTWVMIDPTWGSTTGGVDYFSTLDYDHFAFVIKGKESNYPIPAGGYKLISDTKAKDVHVDFAESIVEQSPTFEVTSQMPKYAMSGIPIFGKIKVTNNGQRLVPQQLMYINSELLLPHDQAINVDPIPPFGFATIPLKLKSEPFLTNTKAEFTTRLSENTTTYSIDFSPLFIRKWGFIGGILLGGLVLIFGVIKVSGKFIKRR